MRAVTFTTLYPNSEMPNFCVFVEQRLRNLLRDIPDVQANVIAPVPWFPSTSPRFGNYSKWARVPSMEQRAGIDVLHPRYPVIPKVGMSVAPLLLALACRPVLRKLIAEHGRIDLIDAHYLFPDGVAAVMLGRWFDLPVVLTARGSDVNRIAGYRLPRRQILWAVRNCSRVITVSDALKQSLVAIGAPEQRIHTLHNGVDNSLFRSLDQNECRTELGLDQDARVVLSVGNLVNLKGHDLLIDVLPLLDDDYQLLIVGDGPMRSNLEAQAEARGVADRVRFCGTVAQPELATYYSAADVFALASSSEGLANVWLESLACGTPVVTTRVGGAPEVIRSRVAGRLVDERSPGAFAKAIRGMLAERSSSAAVQGEIKQFNWKSTSAGLHAVFKTAVEDSKQGVTEVVQ